MDESWKARAPEPKGSVQAPGRWNNHLGVDRVVPDTAQNYCPGLEGLVPWFPRNRNCLDTYEFSLGNACAPSP